MKRTVQTLALILMIAFCFLTTASAADSTFEVDGFTFGINEHNEATVFGYNGSSTQVTIPDKLLGAAVIAIGDYAFINCSQVTSVSFEDAAALTAIGANAFSGCSALTALHLPESIGGLGFGAFQNCTALSEVTLEGVTGIPSQCFYNCGALSTVVLPATCTSIGSHAFGADAELTCVTIPRQCTAIAANAFFNSPNVILYCYQDSAAHRFAEEQQLPYILLDVEPTVISAATVTPEAEAVRFNSEEQEPNVTVTLGEKTLDPRTDYSVSYENNTNAGTATVKVTGQGNYTGVATGRFEIRCVLGDVDGNGAVEITDATYIQRYLALIAIPYTERISLVGDVTRDNELEIVDVTLIQRYLVDIEVPCPINEMIAPAATSV